MLVTDKCVRVCHENIHSYTLHRTICHNIIMIKCARIELYQGPTNLRH